MYTFVYIALYTRDAKKTKQFVFKTGLSNRSNDMSFDILLSW